LELFTNKEIFKLNFMVSLDEGKDAIKTLIEEMIKLFHTIKDFIIHAMQRSRQMFQSGELKDKFKDLLDEDGDGKVEVSDVLTGFSKIGGKLLDQDGDGDFDSKDALNALGNGFGGLLDQDGDGDLDLQDVKRFAVSQFDTDGDGDLDFKDVLNSFKKSNLDSDGDGKVDAKDVMLKFKSIGTSVSHF
jgi:Ca2+-binding EF-hand superfamily protein